MHCQCLIFDLDGVLVDTAKYHYLAWQATASALGIPFTEEDNEQLKGVSRRASLEIILDLGGIKKTEEEKDLLCAEKNERYVDYILHMDQDEILPGVRPFLEDAKARGYRMALGSASKNARTILDRLALTHFFDAIVDGSMTTRAKPDPEVFALAGQLLGANPSDCLVFEDAAAGIQAAHAAGMTAVGVGRPDTLAQADLVIPGFASCTMEAIEAKLEE